MWLVSPQGKREQDLSAIMAPHKISDGIDNPSVRRQTIEIRHVFGENFRVHRLRKVWRQLKPSIAEVQSAAAQCRVDEISPSLVRRVRRPTHAMRQSL